jgi:hypothetical protein
MTARLVNFLFLCFALATPLSDCLYLSRRAMRGAIRANRLPRLRRKSVRSPERASAHQKLRAKPWRPYSPRSLDTYRRAVQSPRRASRRD